MLAKLIELTGLSPDTLTLLLTIGTLVVSIAHSRGNELPLLSWILRQLGAKALPAPSPPATTPEPLPALGEGRILEIIRRAVREAMEEAGRPPA